MQIELSSKEFRSLLDLVYIGNWILNSIRGDDRFKDYDDLESKLFALCRTNGMDVLAEDWNDTVVPSQTYQCGGIQEVIAYYEDSVFYDLLAEEMAMRDMGYCPITPDNYDDMVLRTSQYLQEFEAYGLQRLVLED
jgi:hypothetical protein